MAAANRIIVPEFPLSLPSYDQLNEEQFRKLVRDGFGGVEDYVQRAISEDISTASSLADLTDTTITTPGSKDVLRHDGTDWKNQQLSFSDLSDYLSGLEGDGEVMSYLSGGGGFWYSRPITELIDVPIYGINTSALYPSTSNWADGCDLTIPKTGYYQIDGFARVYGTVGVDVDMRLYYQSTATGVVTIIPGQTSGPVPASEAQSINEGTGGTSVPFDYNSGGISQFVLSGYLDVTSISGTPTLSLGIKRGTGTTGTTYLSVAWLRAQWIATT